MKITLPAHQLLKALELIVPFAVMPGVQNDNLMPPAGYVRLQVSNTGEVQVRATNRYAGGIFTFDNHENRVVESDEGYAVVDIDTVGANTTSGWRGALKAHPAKHEAAATLVQEGKHVTLSLPGTTHTAEVYEDPAADAVARMESLWPKDMEAAEEVGLAWDVLETLNKITKTLRSPMFLKFAEPTGHSGILRPVTVAWLNEPRLAAIAMPLKRGQ